MLPTIPSEASYAQWLVDCTQRYFEALGFIFYSEVQSQNLEKHYPFDIYASITKGNVVKRFGLQVKRPGTAKLGMYWTLNSTQHAQMNRFNWIWYSLPDFLTRTYYKVACFHTLFKSPNFPFVSRLYKSKIGVYYRFGSFANGLIICPIGQMVGKSFDWIESGTLFKEFHFINQVHTYLDFTERKGQIFTNFQTEQERFE